MCDCAQSLNELVPRCMSRAEVVAEAIAEDEAEAAAEAEMWAYVRQVAWAAEATRRRAAALYLRRLAIQRGARPFVPRYSLAQGLGVFEGKLYRIIVLHSREEDGG